MEVTEQNTTADCLFTFGRRMDFKIFNLVASYDIIYLKIPICMAFLLCSCHMTLQKEERYA